MSYCCKTCDKNYSSKHTLTKHYESKMHTKNEANDVIIPDPKLSSFQLKYLGKYVGETIVNKEVYNHIIVNEGVVGLSKGYAALSMNGHYMLLHRYIYYEYYKYERVIGMVVDHKNNTKLDNQIGNLRLVTKAQNALNKVKKENGTSEYFGVSKASAKAAGGVLLWQCQLRSNTFQYNFNYTDEGHAAYHYDLLVKKHALEEFSKLNNIPMPEDFVFKESKTIRSLPKHVREVNGKYYYEIKRFKSKRFGSLEEVVIALEQYKTALEQEKKDKIMREPIKRNSKGTAIIELHNRKGVVVGETEVSDKYYYNLIKYPWHKSMGYVSGTVNGKTVIMARYIMNYDGNDFVDHVDGIPMNNQKYNLRILTAAENTQNKLSLLNSTSKYIGVNYDKSRGKWVAKIKLKGKGEHLGRYLCEKDAARARNKRAKELNDEKGTYFKLNDISED